NARRDGGVKGRICAGGTKLIFRAAAEVELDRVEAPRGERVDVLLVVAPAALPGASAAVAAGVRVDARQEAGGVQRARQPRPAEPRSAAWPRACPPGPPRRAHAGAGRPTASATASAASVGGRRRLGAKRMSVA